MKTLGEAIWSDDTWVCGSNGKLLTFLTNPLTIERVLAHLGLPTRLPEVTQARGHPSKNCCSLADNGLLPPSFDQALSERVAPWGASAMTTGRGRRTG